MDGRLANSVSTAIPRIAGWRHPMDVEPRVRLLLEELLESERTPEEVCRDCPELLTQVRKLWRRKLACDAQLDAMFPALEANSPSSDPSSKPLADRICPNPGPRTPGSAGSWWYGHCLQGPARAIQPLGRPQDAAQRCTCKF